MSLTIRVFRCICGKRHLCAGVSPNSKCACGLGLWEQMWRTGR